MRIQNQSVVQCVAVGCSVLPSSAADLAAKERHG